QAPDDLTVFEDEGHFAASHLEHRASASPVSRFMAETGIEKSRIVHAKLADKRVEWQHFRREFRWDGDGFPRSQDVEFVGVKHDRAGPAGADRIPEFGRVERTALVDIDDSR